MDSANQTTKRRLEEIESELATAQKEYESLKSRWDIEKSHLTNVRSIKEEIEQVKIQAQNAERDGDFGRVAELRYGRLLDLQKNLDNVMKELQQGDSSRMLKEEVSAVDIAEIVARWTGIPVQRMMETERTKLLSMEDKLHERIVGQDDAVRTVSNAIRRSRAGLSDVNKPIGSFLFLGTTGVGKTEMARSLAEFLFDDEHALVRIDMSEYMEKHSVSRLIGAPPGYVGYEEGGQLTEAVRVRPYSVVLFDEIEKAHQDVFNILLQVLDDGRLTDSQGRVVNFTNTIIIMTSNIGSDVLRRSMETLTDDNRDEILNQSKVTVINLLKQQMRPEFLNRIDEIILFKPLIKSEIRQIVSNQLLGLNAKLKAEGITLDVSSDTMDWIATIGYDPQYGARPLKRAIQKTLVDPIALKILSNEINTGDTLTVTVDDTGTLQFSTTSTK